MEKNEEESEYMHMLTGSNNTVSGLLADCSFMSMNTDELRHNFWIAMEIKFLWCHTRTLSAAFTCETVHPTCKEGKHSSTVNQI
jgi:hypothetical protein